MKNCCLTRAAVALALTISGSIASVASASPCADMINLQLLLARPKLQAATLLRTQVEEEYNRLKAIADDAAAKLAVQQSAVNELSLQNDSYNKTVSEQEAALKVLIKALKKKKIKKKKLNALKRERATMNKALIGSQQLAFQASKALYSAQLGLMSVNSEAYFSKLSADQQLELLKEATEEEVLRSITVSDLEKHLAACPV